MFARRRPLRLSVVAEGFRLVVTNRVAFFYGLAGMFLFGYALFRSLVENVREPDSYLPDFPLGLTMGMMLSAPMFIGGAWLIWRAWNRPPAAGPASQA